MNEGSWGTRESVAASTRCFAGREELIEALELKGWAVFLAEDGNMVVGAPKGSPVPGECQSCSGVEGVRIDGGLLLTGGCAIFVPPAVWGDGPKEERGYLLIHQGAEPAFDGIGVTVDEIPTPQQAEEIMRAAARRDK